MSSSWKSLVSLATGYFMVVLDVTVVTVAAPTIGKDLHAGVTALQWMVDGYSLVFAALLLFGGALGDRLGGKPVFLAGLAVFGLASAACGLSPDIGGLVGARLVQGLGAALMVPTALLLVHASYGTREERARAIGVWGGVAGIAAAAGPVIGGVLVTELGWRGVFLINVPVACAAFAVAARFAPAPVPGRRHRIDFPGLLASVIGFAGLITAVNEGGAEGWTAPVVLGGFAVFVAAGLGFLVAERRAAAPAVPLEMFSAGEFSASAVIGVLLNAGFFGLIFVAPLYFQRELHYDPIHAGLAMIPAVISPVLASRWAGRLTGRAGPRRPAVAGLLIGAAGLLGCLVTGASTPYALLVVPLAAAGMAPTLVVPATTFATVESAPPERVGAASAIYNTGRQFGSALGVALFGSLVANSLLSGVHLGVIIGAVAFILGAVAGLLLLTSGGARKRPAAGNDSTRNDSTGTGNDNTEGHAMELSLFEIAPSDSGPAIPDLMADVSRAIRDRGGELLDFQETRAGHLFLIVDGPEAAEAVRAETAWYAGASGPHPVRLVGAEAADVKSSGRAAGYLVEWDLPAGLDMDSYLARKRAASPRYAEVPEVSFLRTYVREDLAKCLCLYDGPGEAAVRDARKVVDAPVSRLHELAGADGLISNNELAGENGRGSVAHRGGGG